MSKERDFVVIVDEETGDGEGLHRAIKVTALSGQEALTRVLIAKARKETTDREGILDEAKAIKLSNQYLAKISKCGETWVLEEDEYNTATAVELLRFDEVY